MSITLMSILPKKVTKYSYREYECFPDDGFRHEIIDGEHYMSPAPATNHQKVSRRIQFQLYSQIESTGRGEVYDAPTDVELDTYDIVQPDILVVMNDRKHIITRKKIKGVPNLVVEILSESNPRNDQTLKMEMYQRNGVQEYWIADPDEHWVDQFVLQSGRYGAAVRELTKISAITIPDAIVDLHEVWA